jgi:hypothetical protein
VIELATEVSGAVVEVVEVLEVLGEVVEDTREN